MTDFGALISYTSKSYHELKMVNITNTNYCFFKFQLEANYIVLTRGHNSPKEITFSMDCRKERQVSQRIESL